MEKVLRCSSRSEVESLLVEGPLVPAHEAEIVSGGEEEGVLLCPLEHVEGDDLH